MNLLFLNPVGILGGGERSLLDLLSALRTARPQWTLHLIPGTEGPLIEEARALGVDVQVVPLPRSLASLGDAGLSSPGSGRPLRTLKQGIRAAAALTAMPGYLRQLRREVSRLSPALIHSNGIKSHLFAGRAAPRNVPVVWHVRDFLSSRAVVGRLLRTVAKFPALAIANSEAVKRDVELTLPGLHTETVYNGIDTHAFTNVDSHVADLATLAGLPPAAPDALCIGLVATYARWKGQLLLMQAASLLKGRRDLPPLRWYIIGGPVYQTAGSQFREEELRTHLRELGLEGEFGLIPFQRSLPSLYRSLDVVVHASTQPEPFGRTIAEAMACGRPVVVANAGGAAELFTHGVDALGLPPGDSNALAEAIATLVKDPTHRARLGQAARETAVARFSRERMAERILSIYDNLIGTS